MCGQCSAVVWFPVPEFYDRVPWLSPWDYCCTVALGVLAGAPTLFVPCQTSGAPPCSADEHTMHALCAAAELSCMMWFLMTEVVGSALRHSCWRPCGTEGLWCCSLALQCCQLQLQHTPLLPAAVHISCAGNRCFVEMDPDILPLLFCPACADPLSANLILHYNMQGTQEKGCS